MPTFATGCKGLASQSANWHHPVMTAFRGIRSAAKIQRFVDRLIAGDTQVEAYIAVNPRQKNLPSKSISDMASRWANSARVKSAYKQALASIPVEKLLNPAEHAKRLLDRGQKAFDEKNYTASAAYDRIIASANGMAKDSSVTVNWNMSDTDLARRLAGDDPEKLAAAASLLGKSSFESDTKGPDRSDNETKH